MTLTCIVALWNVAARLWRVELDPVPEDDDDDDIARLNREASRRSSVLTNDAEDIAVLWSGTAITVTHQSNDLLTVNDQQQQQQILLASNKHKHNKQN